MCVGVVNLKLPRLLIPMLDLFNYVCYYCFRCMNVFAIFRYHAVLFVA
jgi:hypothetical protein